MNLSIQTFDFEVRESPIMENKELKQVRFPKSKKKRIRKKFTKDRRNWKLVDVPKMIRIGNTIYANRIAYQLMQKV